jgi:hypothetical protein
MKCLMGLVPFAPELLTYKSSGPGLISALDLAVDPLDRS